MNIEKICRLKKVLDRYLQSSKIKKFYQKLNFKSFIEVFKNMQKISLLTPLGLVRQYNSPKPYCSPSIIIQENFHLSKHPNE